MRQHVPGPQMVPMHVEQRQAVRVGPRPQVLHLRVLLGPGDVQHDLRSRTHPDALMVLPGPEVDRDAPHAALLAEAYKALSSMPQPVDLSATAHVGVARLAVEGVPQRRVSRGVGRVPVGVVGEVRRDRTLGRISCEEVGPTGLVGDRTAVLGVVREVPHGVVAIGVVVGLVVAGPG